ncbi:MAG: hypothetical protein JXB03_10950 [Spirochaetales bacterium]|nr:hypothetical protein [Spirochaetales bacterium]
MNKSMAVGMIFFAVFAILTVQAQENEETVLSANQNAFGFGLEIGAEVFNEVDENGDTVAVAYQMIILKPELVFGKFGIGLYVPFHYRFLDDGFDFRDEDWVLQDGETFSDKYLPMFQYLRYGMKGDPFYIKLGSIEDGTLGNGFIMGNYANTLFLPDRRVFGAGIDLDGSLFSFPYIGVETFAGNLAAFDVVGARVYGRPILFLNTPVVKNLEIGVTYATDRTPDYYYDFLLPNPGSVSMTGIDFQQPILSNTVVDLALFGDYVFQGSTSGSMIGAGGRFMKIMPWTIQARFIGDDFQPVYFDRSYDLYREMKYYIYEGLADIDGYTGWFASTGLSLLSDMILFNVGMEGTFGDPETDLQYPHLNAVFIVREGVLPGFFFDASYDKRMIKDFDDLVSPENAVIGARVNYRAGSAVITLAYNLRYNPDAQAGEDEWITTTNLSTSISF